ncbi:molybdopterin molybdotransferase MoeA, partial [Inquilinus sp. CA228]|uniref:molybdopterin molybdotransferase MoeA n=1 Tax=Inquilinus sp. CA228 TaxID=3455609 RepID=UPI003F8D3149
MGRLADDCFALGDRLLSVEEAVAEFRTRLAVVAEAETVSLAAAENRFLAEDLVADRSVPPHANAAVDGYAFHFDDLSTGDELRDPGTPVAEGQIYDANRYLLAALLRRLGCDVANRGIVPDGADAVRSALTAAAAEADAIVTSGGVSVGDEDHIKAALEAAGGRLHHWRLAIKPGKPVALGQIGGVPLLGLPGNPVAAMVTFLLVARPLLLHLAGAEPLPLRRFPVAAGFGHGKKPGRREFLRAVLETDPSGALVARRYGREGAGML